METIEDELFNSSTSVSFVYDTWYRSSLTASCEIKNEQTFVTSTNYHSLTTCADYYCNVLCVHGTDIGPLLLVLLFFRCSVIIKRK